MKRTRSLWDLHRRARHQPFFAHALEQRTYLLNRGTMLHTSSRTDIVQANVSIILKHEWRNYFLYFFTLGVCGDCLCLSFPSLSYAYYCRTHSLTSSQRLDDCVYIMTTFCWHLNVSRTMGSSIENADGKIITHDLRVDHLRKSPVVCLSEDE